MKFRLTQVGRVYSGHHDQGQGFPISGRVEEGARTGRDKGWIQAGRSGLPNGTEPGGNDLYDLVSMPIRRLVLFF